MGIDIYMRWNDQTEEEEQAQYTGFSIVHGHVGYLREAYHGDPYATRVLVPEAFDEDCDAAAIPAATLRERLPDTLDAARRRELLIYESDEERVAGVLRSYEQFVELAERLEAEGREPRIVASW